MNSTTGLANGTIAARRRAFDRHAPGDILPSPMSHNCSPSGSPLTPIPSPGRLNSPTAPSPTGKTSRMIEALQTELDSTKAQLERSKLEVRSCRREIGTLLRREGDSKDLRDRMRSESEALNNVIERKERIAADALERLRAAENAAAHHMEERQAIEERAGERVARAEAGRVAAEGAQARAEAEAHVLRDSVRSLRKVWARDVAECREEMERLARQMRSEREHAAAKRDELLELVQAQAIEHQGIAALVEQMEAQRVKAARVFQRDTEHFQTEIGSLRAAMARSEEDAEQARMLARELADEVARLRQVNTRSIAEHIRRSSMEERKEQIERGTQPAQRVAAEAGAQTEPEARPISPRELPKSVMRDAETQSSPMQKPSSAPLVAAAAIATAAAAVPGLVALAKSTSCSSETSRDLEPSEDAPLTRSDSLSDVSMLLDCPPSPSKSVLERELPDALPPQTVGNDVLDHTTDQEGRDLAPIVVLQKPVDSDCETHANGSEPEIVVVPSPARPEEKKAEKPAPHEPELQSRLLELSSEKPEEVAVPVEGPTERLAEANATITAPALLTEMPADGEQSPLARALQLMTFEPAERTSEVDGYESSNDSRSVNDSAASISSDAAVYPGDYSPGPYSPAPYSPSGYSYSQVEYSSAGYSPYSPAFSSSAVSVRSTYSDDDGSMDETVGNEAPAPVKTEDAPEAVVVIGAFDTVDTFVTVPASPDPGVADGEGSPDSATLPDVIPIRDASHNAVPEMRTSIDSDKTVYDADAVIEGKPGQSAVRDLSHIEPDVHTTATPEHALSSPAAGLVVQSEDHVMPIVAATAVAAVPVAAMLHHVFASDEAVQPAAPLEAVGVTEGPRDLVVEPVERDVPVESVEPVEPIASVESPEFNQRNESLESVKSSEYIDSMTQDVEPYESLGPIESTIPVSPTADIAFTTPTPLESLLPDTTPDRDAVDSAPSPSTTELVTPAPTIIPVAGGMEEHALYKDLDCEDKHEEEPTPTPRGLALPAVPLVVIQDATPISSEPQTPVVAVATPGEALAESQSTRTVEEGVPTTQSDLSTEFAAADGAAALSSPTIPTLECQAVKPEDVPLPEDEVLPQDIPLPEVDFLPEEIPLPEETEEEDNILSEDVPLPKDDIVPKNLSLPEGDLVEDVPLYEENSFPVDVSSRESVHLPKDITLPEDVPTPADIPSSEGDFLPGTIPLPESVADAEELRDEIICEPHTKNEEIEAVDAVEDILASPPVSDYATREVTPSTCETADISRRSMTVAATPRSLGPPLDMGHDSASSEFEDVPVPIPATETGVDSQALITAASSPMIGNDGDSDFDFAEAEATPFEPPSALVSSTSSSAVIVPTPGLESEDGEAASASDYSGDSDWVSIDANGSANASEVIPSPTEDQSPHNSEPPSARAFPAQLPRSLPETPVDSVSIALPASPTASPIVHTTPLAPPTDLRRSVVVAPSAVPLPNSPVEESVSLDSESEYDSETDAVPFEDTEEPTPFQDTASSIPTTLLADAPADSSQSIDVSETTIAPTARPLPDSPIEESYASLSASESEYGGEPEEATFKDTEEPDTGVYGVPAALLPVALTPVDSTRSLAPQETIAAPTTIPLPDSPVEELSPLPDSDRDYESGPEDNTPFCGVDEPVLFQGVVASSHITSSLEDATTASIRALEQPSVEETIVAPAALPLPDSPIEETSGLPYDSDSECDNDLEPAFADVEETAPSLIPTLPLDVPTESTRSIEDPELLTLSSLAAVPLPASPVEENFGVVSDAGSEYASDAESVYDDEPQEGVAFMDVETEPSHLALGVPLPESPFSPNLTLSPEPALNVDEVLETEAIAPSVATEVDAVNIPLPDSPASASSLLPEVASKGLVEDHVDIDAPVLLAGTAPIAQATPASGAGSAAFSLPDVPDTPFSEAFPSPSIALRDVVEAPVDAEVPLLYATHCPAEMVPPAEPKVSIDPSPEAPGTPTFESFPGLPDSPVTTPVEQARNVAWSFGTPVGKYIDADAYPTTMMLAPVSPATVALPVSPQDSPVLTEVPLTLSPSREVEHDNAIDSAAIALPTSPAESSLQEATSSPLRPREVDATLLARDEDLDSADVPVPESPMSEYLDSPSFSLDDMVEQSTTPEDLTMPPPALLPLPVSMPDIVPRQAATTPVSEWLAQDFPTANALTTRALGDLDELGAAPPAQSQLLMPAAMVLEPELDAASVPLPETPDDLATPFQSTVTSRVVLPETPLVEPSLPVDDIAPSGAPTGALLPAEIDIPSIPLGMPSETAFAEDVRVPQSDASPNGSADALRDSPRDEFYAALDHYVDKEGDVDVDEFFTSPPSEVVYIASEQESEPEAPVTANASLPDSPAEEYFPLDEDNSLQLIMAEIPVAEAPVIATVPAHPEQGHALLAHEETLKQLEANIDPQETETTDGIVPRSMSKVQTSDSHRTSLTPSEPPKEDTPGQLSLSPAALPILLSAATLATVVSKPTTRFDATESRKRSAEPLPESTAKKVTSTRSAPVRPSAARSNRSSRSSGSFGTSHRQFIITRPAPATETLSEVVDEPKMDPATIPLPPSKGSASKTGLVETQHAAAIPLPSSPPSSGITSYYQPLSHPLMIGAPPSDTIAPSPPLQPTSGSPTPPNARL